MSSGARARAACTGHSPVKLMRMANIRPSDAWAASASARRSRSSTAGTLAAPVTSTLMRRHRSTSNASGSALCTRPF